MAITDYMNMFGNTDQTSNTDEEQKKKESEQGLFDIAGQMLNNRIDNAIGNVQQRYNNVSNAFTNPTSQNIMNLIGGPVSPVSQQGQQPGQQPGQNVTQNPQTLNANPNPSFNQPVASMLPQMPTPGPGVQVAGPMVTPPTATQGQQGQPGQPGQQPNVVQPVLPQTYYENNGQASTSNIPANPQVGQAPNAGIVQTQPGGAQTQVQTQPSQTNDWQDQVSKIANDPHQLYAYAGNPNNPKEGIELAKKIANENYNHNIGLEKARMTVDEAIKSGNMNDLAREISKVKGEGSYVKAYLYQRFGLSDLAKEEQQKLGAGGTYGVAYGPNGERALVKYDANGLPHTGFNNEGKEISQTELSQYATAALGPNTKSFMLPSVHGTPVQRTNAQGQVETGLMMYDPRTQQSYVQVGNSKQPTSGWTTMAQTPIAVYNAAAAKEGGTAAGQGLTPPTPQPMPGSVVPQNENAVQRATRLGLPITSGVRDVEKQAILWNESVRAGRTGFTAEGNPIAKPGTSQHQNANAVDMVLTPEQRRQAFANGFTNPYPNDPNHYELRPTVSQGTTKSVPEQKAEIETAAAGKKTRTETAAKIVDEKLNNLNSIQEQATRGLDALNDDKHLFGGGTNAVSRGYYKVNPLATESDAYRNTKEIMGLTQRENLTNLASLLKGSFSDKDLAYINKNMINENSSPSQVKRWLESYVRASRRAYEQTASSVNEPNAPSPSAPAQSETARVKKYNPATGKVE
jgi:hypothetical protein